MHLKFYEQHPNQHDGLKLGLAWENEVQRAPQYVDVPYDMDFHPLIEYDVPLPKRQYVSFLLNPIFERNIVGGAGWEGSWGAQMLYHWSRDFSAGVESYGDIGEFKDMGQEHNKGAYAMPVLMWKWVSLGVGIGLTAGSDRLVTKLNIGVPIDTSGADVRTWF